MKNKKGGKKKAESDSSSSSSSSSSSEEESSDSSSESSASPAKKNRNKDVKKTHSKKRGSKSGTSSPVEERKNSKRKPVDVLEERAKIDRKEIEHSKWDSPVERIDKKKKVERRDSESQEHDQNKKEKEQRDKEGRAEKSDGGGERRERRDERRTDRAEHSREGRNSDRPYNRRFEDRGRQKDYRRERFDERGDRDRKDERHQRSDDRRDRKRSPHREQRNNKRHRSRSNSFDHAKATWGRDDPNQNDKKDNKSNNTKDKEKPNFGLSGKLTEETNTYKGVVIKYSEPPEARKPKRRWRLYPFKGEKAMQTLYIHRESAYLIGRDRKVVDLPVDHPSCSKQHAALQYRLVPFTRDDGSAGKRVRPYLIDLDSANGTYINNKKIDSKKYVELLEKDVIKFGYSSREYVLLHENSKDEAMDDDVKLEEEGVKNEPED